MWSGSRPSPFPVQKIQILTPALPLFRRPGTTLPSHGCPPLFVLPFSSPVALLPAPPPAVGDTSLEAVIFPPLRIFPPAVSLSPPLPHPPPRVPSPVSSLGSRIRHFPRIRSFFSPVSAVFLHLLELEGTVPLRRRRFPFVLSFLMFSWF